MTEALEGQSGDIDGSDRPRVRAGIDLTRAGLSLEEGFLVSRVDGNTSVSDLSMLIGKPKEHTLKLVERLFRAGVLIFTDEEASDDPYEGFAFPEEVLAEDVDLSEEEKRNILFTHGHLETWTLYRLLECRPRDSLPSIKAAYRAQSLKWHPDRFRRDKLGTYKARINQIFHALTKANQVLSSPERKAAYDREHAPEFDEEDMAAILQEQRRQERTEQRSRERVERRRKKNPVLQRMKKGKESFQKAKALHEQGESIEALRFAQAALAYSPSEECKALVKLLQETTAVERVLPLIRKGQNAESMTNWDDAVTLFKEAVRLAPEHGQARLRLAYNLVMANRPVEMANEHIQRAFQLLPEDPETHFVRGLCYQKSNMDKAAIGAFQRALELKPNYAEAKKRLKKLRWGF